MKILSNHDLGFQEVYTHEDVLPEDMEQPKKHPFIILTLPANRANSLYLLQNFPLFKKLGYSEVQNRTQILTITSKRKVGIVIRSILSSPDYNHEQNAELLHRLLVLEEELSKTEIDHRPPPRSKNGEQYVYVDEKIERKKNAPQPNHSVEKVKKIGKDTVEIFKFDGTGRRITQIEAFNGIAYRLLLNDRTPKVRSVHDRFGNRIGVFSREIKNFQSLHDYYIKQEEATGEMRSPPQRVLVKLGIGRILGAAYAEEENDLHGGNIVYDPIYKKIYKIDHDQATWPITSKYRNLNPNKPISKKEERPYGVKPIDAFPITQKDINNFPFLYDAKPNHFPDEADDRTLDLEEIDNYPEFNKDVFSVFLKRALFDEQIYRAIANETIENKKLQEELVTHKTERSEILRKELIKNRKFLYFILDNPDIKEQILHEFQEYNDDYEENSPLRLNINDLGNKIDLLLNQTLDQIEVPLEAVKLFNRYYKPLQDIRAYEYRTTDIESSPQRKQETMNQLEVYLRCDSHQAEAMFDQLKNLWASNPLNSEENIIERHAEKNLDKLFADLINLNGRVGVFGGEKRILAHDNEIIIPKGAAAIFDLYQKYQNGELSSAVETLEAIIGEATIANAYQGHTLFNRRQSETQDFYNSIVAIQHRILPENEMNFSLIERQEPSGIYV